MKHPGVTRAAAALMAVGLFAFAQEAPPVDYAKRIAELKIERRRLQDGLRATLTDDAKLIDPPTGGVLIGLPTSLVERVVAEAVAGPLKNVRLVLKKVAKMEKKDVIRAKVLFRIVTLGEYVLTVDVEEVRASMKPKVPKLTFGSNRIAVDLPVSVEAGAVKAKLKFTWDGQNLAGALCGDLSAEHDLRAVVPPIAVRVMGRFDVEAKGEQLLVKPVLAPIELAFKIEPPQKTWDFVEDLIKSRNAVCEAALRKAEVGQKVRELVSRGFTVKLPDDWVRPIVLPASFRDTVDVKGRKAGLTVKPTGVSVTKTRVWYGANLEVKSANRRTAKAAAQ